MSDLENIKAGVNASNVATAAKQPSLGTAGTASSNVITVQGIAAMTPILSTSTAAASEVHIGEVGLKIATPSSVLTRPSDTNGYSIGDLVASSVTAGSVVVPSFTASRIATGNGCIRRARLYTNITAGMGSIGMTIRFWTTAPTYTNGDNGAYAVATGNAGYLGKMTITSFNQFADGAAMNATPDTGSEINFALASGSLIYWDLQINTALTPISAQTFTLIPEIYQN